MRRTAVTITTPYFRSAVRQAMSSGRKRKSRVEVEAEAREESAEHGPENWLTVYNNILEMRKERNAPVDSMGCERAHDPEADPKLQRFSMFGVFNVVNL